MKYKTKFNLLYEQIMNELLKEGGHAVDNVSQGILKENIQPTINYFETLIFIPLNISRDDWTAEIGSVGKKDRSGDIDIAINTTNIANKLNLEKPRDVLELIKNKLIEYNLQVKLNSGDNTALNCAFPIQGNSQNGEYIQIDLFQSKFLNFAKFNHYAPMQGTSKYKGSVRSDLTNMLIKIVTLAAVNDGLPENFKNKPYMSPYGVTYPGEIFSYTSLTDNGVNKSTKTWIGKRGGYNKNPTELKRELLYGDPQVMLDNIFGKNKYTVHDFESFESIWNNVLFDKDFPYPDKRDDIVKEMYHAYIHDKKEIPTEVLEYIKGIKND